MGVYKFDLENLTPEELQNTDVLQYISHVIFEVVILDGTLDCNNCGKSYQVKDGVPNMVLDDNEV
jgi:multifunctional methyltransferase subunit TRM112